MLNNIHRFFFDLISQALFNPNFYLPIANLPIGWLLYVCLRLLVRVY